MKMVAMLSPILQDVVNWNREAIRKLFLAANFGALAFDKEWVLKSPQA